MSANVDDGQRDEALGRLIGFGPEYGGGLASHAPMVIDALFVLDRADAIHPWLDVYLRDLEPMPTPVGRRRLGELATVADWQQHYRQRLDDEPWAVVATDALGQLAPGLSGAATHGWLRTAHAVHGLQGGASASRITELSAALGYWAACHRVIAGDPTPLGPFDLVAAASALPALPPPPGTFFISDAVANLDHEPAFAGAVAAAAAPLSIASVVAVAARLALRGASTMPIAYVHAVTATCALATVAPLLEPAAVPGVAALGWQAAAALASAYPASGPLPLGESGAAVDLAALADRAIESGDEHAIKVVAAAVTAREALGVHSPAAAAAALVPLLH